MSKYYNKEEIDKLIANVEYDPQPLIDYITNLQEENKKLKEQLELEKSICSNQAQRILKAGEYIKENGILDLNGYDLLKILKGEENEEN